MDLEFRVVGFQMGGEVGRVLKARARHWDGALCALGIQQMARPEEKWREGLGHRKGRSWVTVAGPWAFVHGRSEI